MPQDSTDTPDWFALPRPRDDGLADHLVGLRLPPVLLKSTVGPVVDLSGLAGLGVIYVFPRMGTPGLPNPPGWDAIPGARGCTPQACAFRDRYAEMRALGVDYVYGASSQDWAFQRDAVARLHLPFPLLSDADGALRDALRLPAFETAGLVLLKRLTLIVRDGRIEHVFYPVFPPDRSAEETLRWLRDRGTAQGEGRD